jgi:hypothetical protein
LVATVIMLTGIHVYVCEHPYFWLPTVGKPQMLKVNQLEMRRYCYGYEEVNSFSVFLLLFYFSPIIYLYLLVKCNPAKCGHSVK